MNIGMKWDKAVRRTMEVQLPPPAVLLIPCLVPITYPSRLSFQKAIEKLRSTQQIQVKRQSWYSK